MAADDERQMVQPNAVGSKRSPAAAFWRRAVRSPKQHEPFFTTDRRTLVVRRPTRGSVGVAPDAIIGRRRELDALRAWLDATREGAGRLILCAGEPGIGKSRLAREFAGVALAGGTAVAWGRCGQGEGAPVFWPWRQVLRSLGVDTDGILEAEVESPQDRFRVFDDVSEAVLASVGSGGLVIVLDDIHWADELSLLVLRHLAHQLPGFPLLVFAAFRDVEPASILHRVVPDLLRSPAVERLELRGFDLAEVREQLLRMTASDSAADARATLDLTGGNPLFVREVSRAMADGTWRPDRLPRSVLDVVRVRLERVSPECRRLVQAAAVVGRDFSLPLVARALDGPVAQCLPVIDEAIAFGLVDRVGHTGDYRFVHALTRDAVEASLTTADRTALHRAVAAAIESHFASNLPDHLADIARHWGQLAPTVRAPPPGCGPSGQLMRPFGGSHSKRARASTVPRWPCRPHRRPPSSAVGC